MSFRVLPPRPSQKPADSPRILIIGAGSRGSSYAGAIHTSTVGTVVGVAEPIDYKRGLFISKYNLDARAEKLIFTSWTELVADDAVKEKVKREVDGVCICTLDETHAEIIIALRPLNIHILCEKPLSTTLDSCVQIYNTITSPHPPPVLLAIGHVLRYSPHNMLLRKLVCEDKILGEIININHTEPVGWWHFAHSYVRGNWRNSATSAPSLLTKCCHDIDLLLWLLCTPTSTSPPHLPSTVSSSGSLIHFKPSRKPPLAGTATNCYSCPAEQTCLFSARSIYATRNLARGNTGWPIKIVVPEIENAPNIAAAQTLLEARLKEDYTQGEAEADKSYYGRCVYEAGNNVVDNQVVTITWEDAPLQGALEGRGAKTATLTMVAFSKRICERFTRIYGTRGELEADSSTIKVHDFENETTKVFTPEMDMTSGHGGGDAGLARAFVDAVRKVKAGWEVERAQREVVGVTVEEVLRSHAAVFWAEEARLMKEVVGWEEWWERNVEGVKEEVQV